MPDQRIAVVGAGAFGSWIALHAVRAGFKTTLIDQYGPANELSSSAGASRIIRRAYGADEIYTLLAQRSLELWTAFLAGENRSDCFRRTGVLWLANDGEASLYAAREIFERHKLTHEFLHSGAIRKLCPEMNIPAESVAIYEPYCGALLAQKAVRAVVEAAIRGGVRYVTGRVDPLQTELVEADVLIFACGSWLPKLFPEVLGTAIFPTRQEVFFFEPPAAPSLPIWIDQTDARIPYGFPVSTVTASKSHSTARVRASIPIRETVKFDLNRSPKRPIICGCAFRPCGRRCSVTRRFAITKIPPVGTS